MRAANGPFLTVVCGNSSIRLRRWSDGGCLVLPSHAPDPTALRSFLTESPIAACAAVSVRVDAWHEIEPVLRAEVPVQLAGIDLPCPLPLDYDTPNTLGADRWLAALAAHRRFGRALAIDCGSATTINLVEADGRFRGGAIAPGLAALRAGMRAATPALPAAELEAMPRVPARSSQESVDTGVLLGFAGMVERLVAEAVRSARGPLQIVVTGGAATVLLRHARLRAEHEPDLVHLGLLALLEPTWNC